MNFLDFLFHNIEKKNKKWTVEILKPKDGDCNEDDITVLKEIRQNTTKVKMHRLASLTNGMDGLGNGDVLRTVVYPWATMYGGHLLMTPLKDDVKLENKTRFMFTLDRKQSLSLDYQQI